MKRLFLQEYIMQIIQISNNYTAMSMGFVEIDINRL